MDTIGKVNSISVEHNVEWVIPSFLLLSEDDDKSYNSHRFSSNAESWFLRFYPNGSKKNDSIGSVDMFLMREKSSSEIRQDFSLSLKNSNAKKEMEHHLTYTFKRAGDGYGRVCIISKHELVRRKLELLPADALTIVCTLKYPESIRHAHANDKFLCEDFKKVLLNGLNHDLILKVGDTELRAHQDILMARSQVFGSMLSHDMKEKNSGVIDIPDCDPQAMKQFLSYIYTGKVDTLDQSNMFKLYYIADKYDVKGLKEECLIFIKNSLSLTNICKVFQLSLNHSDSSLTDCATKYFINNGVEIMRTMQWQSFLKDNFTIANELTIKAIQNSKNAKT